MNAKIHGLKLWVDDTALKALEDKLLAFYINKSSLTNNSAYYVRGPTTIEDLLC